VTYIKNPSYFYKNTITLKTTPEKLFSTVSDLRFWEKIYPNTLVASYYDRSDEARPGAILVEKYWGITGYHVFKHVIKVYEPPYFIEWEGKTIYGGLLVLLFLPCAKHIHGHFRYKVSTNPDNTINWTRECEFTLESKSLFSRFIYIIYMPLFRLELMKALRLYQNEVREMLSAH
jgi:hypothetical protein